MNIPMIQKQIAELQSQNCILFLLLLFFFEDFLNVRFICVPVIPVRLTDLLKSITAVSLFDACRPIFCVDLIYHL